MHSKHGNTIIRSNVDHAIEILELAGDGYEAGCPSATAAIMDVTDSTSFGSLLALGAAAEAASRFPNLHVTKQLTAATTILLSNTNRARNIA